MKPSLLLLTSLVSTSTFLGMTPQVMASPAQSANVVLGSSKALAPVKIDFVQVGDPGNPADRNGYGAVEESFQLGKFDVTAAQYCQFLNAVASKEDTYGLYDERMSTDLDVASIDRTGSAGNYKYTPKKGAEQFPVVYVSWFCAARFCNWLQNGQPVGVQDETTTENGAYTLLGAIKDVNGDKETAPSDFCRLNPGAKFYIPSENQYYKAAYFKKIPQSADYWVYATSSDQPPGNGNEPGVNIGKNKANYFISGNSLYTRNTVQGTLFSSKTQRNNAQYTTKEQPYLTPVGYFSKTTSPYGAYDMAGNVSQWLTSPAGTVGSTRPIRGGCWGPAPLSKEDQKEYDALKKADQLYKFFRKDGKGQCMQGEIQLNKENSMVIDGSLRRDYIGFRVASPL